MKSNSQHIRLTPQVVHDVFSESPVEQYAISYSRVSSESQVEGFSLELQRRECREASAKLGTRLLEEFIEEGVSGTLVDRPALAKAILFCAKNKGKIAYFIVKDVDRVARDTLVYLTIKTQLNELGVQLYSINQPTIGEKTPEARFLEGIFSNVAQLERDKIHQRTVAGQREAREQGAWIHAPPYGYETDRNAMRVATLKPHSERAPVVRKAFQLYDEGLDQEQVCEKLNALGYRTTRDGKFTKQTMSHLLRNPIYVGKIRDPQETGKLIDGVHPAIVTLELWRRVQLRLNGRGSFPIKSQANPHFPLVNVLHCHNCNGPLTGGFSTGKAGKKYGYYHCWKKGCKSKNIPYQSIEKEFERALQSIEPTKRCIDLFEKDFIGVYREKWQQSITEKTVLIRRQTELEDKRTKIEDMFIMGKLAEQTYERQLEKVNQELLRVSEAKEDHVLSESRMKEVLLFSRKFLTSILNTWKNGTVERKRLIQRIIFPAGIRCTAQGKLGTLELPPLLRLLEASSRKKSQVVGQLGFEPRAKSLRGSCSTRLSY